MSLSTLNISGRAHPALGSSSSAIATATGMFLGSGDGAGPHFCSRGSTCPGCESASACVRNTKKLLFSSPARRFSAPGEHFPPSSSSWLGDFPPQGSPITSQSPFLLSLGRGCSLSLHSKGSVGILGCSDVCKEHCWLSTFLLPNSQEELLVEPIVFILSSQLPALSAAGVSHSSELPGSSAEE